MNKKGFVGLFGIISLILVGATWLGLSSWLKEVGQVAATSNIGLLAFVFGNINGVIAFFYFLAWIVVLKY